MHIYGAGRYQKNIRSRDDSRTRQEQNIDGIGGGPKYLLLLRQQVSLWQS